MGAYRCYFLLSATTLSSVSGSINTSNEFSTDEFIVDTDEQARLMVESLCQMRSNHVQGFELWQGSRLVDRHGCDGWGTAGIEYRCYFLRSATIRFGVPSSINNIEEFTAATDDEARLMTERLYQKRAGQVHGYELWQGTRLVVEHPIAAPARTT